MMKRVDCIVVLSMDNNRGLSGAVCHRGVSSRVDATFVNFRCTVATFLISANTLCTKNHVERANSVGSALEVRLTGFPPCPVLSRN